MSLAVADDRFHELGTLLIRENEFYFKLFAQQQLDWCITGHAANSDFDTSAVNTGLFAVALDRDAQAKIQRASLPARFGCPVLLGPCWRGSTHRGESSVLPSEWQ